MQIFFLDDWPTFFLDIAVWVFFHLSIGTIFSKLPLKIFHQDAAWFQTKKWEQGGEIYEKLFRVKRWKDIIPSGAALYKNAYEVKHLSGVDSKELLHWIKESCRSEVCHWVMMIPGIFFFMWNSVETGWLMVAYAIANNAVPIIMQRYNRPRMRKFLSFVQGKERKAAANESAG